MVWGQRLELPLDFHGVGALEVDDKGATTWGGHSYYSVPLPRVALLGEHARLRYLGSDYAGLKNLWREDPECLIMVRGARYAFHPSAYRGQAPLIPGTPFKVFTETTSIRDSTFIIKQLFFPDHPDTAHILATGSPYLLVESTVVKTNAKGTRRSSIAPDSLMRKKLQDKQKLTGIEKDTYLNYLRHCDSFSFPEVKGKVKPVNPGESGGFFKRSFQVRPSDIDVYKHVNQSQYVAFACDTIKLAIRNYKSWGSGIDFPRVKSSSADYKGQLKMEDHFDVFVWRLASAPSIFVFTVESHGVVMFSGYVEYWEKTKSKL